jgi:hypothetical protein
VCERTPVWLTPWPEEKKSSHHSDGNSHKGQLLKNQVMGKNMLGKVLHDVTNVATRLKLANPKDYTFHSYRRMSATTAANGGMTRE